MQSENGENASSFTKYPLTSPLIEVALSNVLASLISYIPLAEIQSHKEEIINFTAKSSNSDVPDDSSISSGCPQTNWDANTGAYRSTGMNSFWAFIAARTQLLFSFSSYKTATCISIFFWRHRTIFTNFGPSGITWLARSSFAMLKSAFI